MESCAEKLTPMEEQYFNVKKQYSDCLVFYRLGDFYELFNEDAVIASKILGLVLTHRQSMQMCGIPWHAHEMYLAKLVKQGYRIAICEQVETPDNAKQRGHKGPIERKVTRIISSGTVIEDALLNSNCNNWLLAIVKCIEKVGIAYADVSSGNFLVEEIEPQDVLSCITRINPSEIICLDEFCANKEMLSMLENYKNIIRILPNIKYTKEIATSRLAKFYNVKFIDAFVNYSACIVQATAMVVDYISTVYNSVNPTDISLNVPKLVNVSDYMLMDSFTQKSLELDNTQSGEYKGSLLSCIDTTKTAQGSRMLARWVKSPLVNLEKINIRLDYVEFFTQNNKVLETILDTLETTPDLERSVSRIMMKKCGPRDIKAVQSSLQRFTTINELLSNHTVLNSLAVTNLNISQIVEKLSGAIIDTPPLLTRDGGFIRSGYDELLDEYRDLLDNGETIIKNLQRKYATDTEIPTLKIKNNGILGYFIEITPTYINRVTSDFIHRQTLGSCIRYTTKELSSTANEIYSAEANARQRELFIFETLVEDLASHHELLRKISDRISFIDVITSFARNAQDRHYVRPQFNDDNYINICDGRHPVVENSLRSSGEKFIENDYDSKCNLTLLTGPNMGGKSTYLRQNALIMIMAQIGSFVPARSAKLAVVDRIFSRVGASDDIASGRSTFMVEMLETATILNQATSKSFVILDEIGRGTSTQDGLAIAWAVAEELALNIKVNTIFATHYHELFGIRETIPTVKFSSVQIHEDGENIVFLHKIAPGFTGRSFGIHVASIAGFPKKVLARANEIMQKLSNESNE